LWFFDLCASAPLREKVLVAAGGRAGGSVSSVVQERKHATRTLVQFSRYPIGAGAARGRPGGCWARPVAAAEGKLRAEVADLG
jgi:hypothetical protein